MATALFGRARAIASFNLSGLPDTQAEPDGRQYRKRSARFGRQHDGDYRKNPHDLGAAKIGSVRFRGYGK